MKAARALPWSLLVIAALSSGCVDRRFVIESNVPNAQVFIDNKPVGAAPADAPFDYYGYYNVTLVHPNYGMQTQRVRVRAPWYAYPPFDLVVESLWPFHIEDVRRYFIKFEAKPQVPNTVLIENADQLRQRGLTLPPPSHPPAAPATPPAPILTAPVPVPSAQPSIPAPVPSAQPNIPAP